MTPLDRKNICRLIDIISDVVAMLYGHLSVHTKTKTLDKLHDIKNELEAPQGEKPTNPQHSND